MESIDFAREVRDGKAVVNARGVNKRRTVIAVGLGAAAVAAGVAIALL